MSKHLEPLSVPFFPTIFFRNQFRTEPKWPPSSTDLTSKVAIVTGANQGLGLETSDQLLSFNLSHLIIAVRSQAKGEAAATYLRGKHPGATIDVLPLDMSSYDSIQSFVIQVEQLKRLDIVILNAGVHKMKFDVVPSTKHEESIQVNYISTALLCILLLPVLKRKSVDGPGRMTIVSSGLAFDAKFKNRTASPLLPSFDEPKSFDSQETYCTSKLLVLMLLYKVADYTSADDVTINAVDPGFVKDTSLSRDLSLIASALMTPFKKLVARPLKVGASTYVDAAVVKGKDSHGCYIMSWQISPFPDLMYTTEGKRATDELWQETISELSFANVTEVLESLGKV